MGKWGRDDLEWDELAEETWRFLGERARLRRTTTYTELSTVLAQRTGKRRFDFGTEHDRTAMGALLGEVATTHLEDVGALVSAIVIYLNENDAGAGFYRLAKREGLLPLSASGDERLTFWAGQVATVHEHFAPPRLN